MTEPKDQSPDYSSALEQAQEIEKVNAELDANIAEAERELKDLETELTELGNMKNEGQLLPAQEKELQTLPEQISEIHEILSELKLLRDRAEQASIRFLEIHQKGIELLTRLRTRKEQ